MTIDELIERLEDLRDELGGDAEVRLMTQENWPFENSVAGVTTSHHIRGAEDEDEDCEPEDDDRDVAYIVEGRQLGYGSKAAWNVCH